MRQTTNYLYCYRVLNAMWQCAATNKHAKHCLPTCRYSRKWQKDSFSVFTARKYMILVPLEPKFLVYYEFWHFMRWRHWNLIFITVLKPFRSFLTFSYAKQVLFLYPDHTILFSYIVAFQGCIIHYKQAKYSPKFIEFKVNIMLIMHIMS